MLSPGPGLDPRGVVFGPFLQVSASAESSSRPGNDGDP